MLQNPSKTDAQHQTLCPVAHYALPPLLRCRHPDIPQQWTRGASRSLWRVWQAALHPQSSTRKHTSFTADECKASAGTQTSLSSGPGVRQWCVCACGPHAKLLWSAAPALQDWQARERLSAVTGMLAPAG